MIIFAPLYLKQIFLSVKDRLANAGADNLTTDQRAEKNLQQILDGLSINYDYKAGTIASKANALQYFAHSIESIKTSSFALAEKDPVQAMTTLMKFHSLMDQYRDGQAKNVFWDTCLPILKNILPKCPEDQQIMLHQQISDKMPGNMKMLFPPPLDRGGAPQPPAL